MFLKAIDGLFTLVHRFLCFLIVNSSPKVEAKGRPIGKDWQDDKGKWHRVYDVYSKDQPMP